MSEGTPQLSLGQILDRVFRLMRAYWGLLLGVAIVPMAVVMVPLYMQRWVLRWR